MLPWWTVIIWLIIGGVFGALVMGILIGDDDRWR